ncbi:hypothetical protein R3W88_022632 [Solanum pinnatisectum]|uniref:Uncharacterized protein n=1 Tax=Solanum pinnatisectum TaxID=50273 RepID=A0AAV9LXC5_9SOLN|nr:hypothetical protein R3W88_022632 [Solanum pinnatisectum]
MMLMTRAVTSYNRQLPPGYLDSRYYVCNNQVTFYSPRPMQNPQNNAPHPNFETKPPQVFTPLCETRTQLFDRLKEARILQPCCAYHSGVIGHDTEKCIPLKHKIEDLIDNEMVKHAHAPPNVNTNLLPEHKE